ncbi:hypothetical protein [Anaeromyxobacter oryzae]|uniref:Lipoprotein n=1 Tax=Anaeromyxobacter oryzae TaxID=2918170 RepID=A0ABM7X3D6_9BACT|nr:hypothetical protein [Anaeromyxobacter oryzae]BDG06311.1 hypothetical protein AMOR_53070 [Anaeromyxobacter oryzae]
MSLLPLVLAGTLVAQYTPAQHPLTAGTLVIRYDPAQHPPDACLRVFDVALNRDKPVADLRACAGTRSPVRFDYQGPFWWWEIFISPEAFDALVSFARSRAAEFDATRSDGSDTAFEISWFEGQVPRSYVIGPDRACRFLADLGDVAASKGEPDVARWAHTTMKRVPHCSSTVK